MEFSSLFDEAHAITCNAAVRQLPDEHYVFRPVPGMMSAFDLVLFIPAHEDLPITSDGLSSSADGAQARRHTVSART